MDAKSEVRSYRTRPGHHSSRLSGGDDQFDQVPLNIFSVSNSIADLGDRFIRPGYQLNCKDGLSCLEVVEDSGGPSH